MNSFSVFLWKALDDSSKERLGDDIV